MFVEAFSKIKIPFDTFFVCYEYKNISSYINTEKVWSYVRVCIFFIKAKCIFMYNSRKPTLKLPDRFTAKYIFKILWGYRFSVFYPHHAISATLYPWDEVDSVVVSSRLWENDSTCETRVMSIRRPFTSAMRHFDVIYK